MVMTLPSGSYACSHQGSDFPQLLIEMSIGCCYCSMEVVQRHMIDLRREHLLAMHQLQMDASSLSMALAQHMDEARAKTEEQTQQLRCVTCACDMA